MRSATLRSFQEQHVQVKIYRLNKEKNLPECDEAVDLADVNMESGGGGRTLWSYLFCDGESTGTGGGGKL